MPSAALANAGLGQTFSKEQLYAAAFGYEGLADASAITEHIKNIRAKLRPLNESPIETVGELGTNGKKDKAPGWADALFWSSHYHKCSHFAVGGSLVGVGLTILMQMKFVYPASTAADGVDNLISSLTAGTLTPEEIPYYYRWAVFDSGHQLIDAGNMNERRLAYANRLWPGDRQVKGTSSYAVSSNCQTFRKSILCGAV